VAATAVVTVGAAVMAAVAAVARAPTTTHPSMPPRRKAPRVAEPAVVAGVEVDQGLRLALAMAGSRVGAAVAVAITIPSPRA